MGTYQGDDNEKGLLPPLTEEEMEELGFPPKKEEKADEEEPGPARKLVERVLAAERKLTQTIHECVVRQQVRLMDDVFAAADDHDASTAALVEAAERALASMSGILASAEHDEDAREQLRVALEAARKGGDDGTD